MTEESLREIAERNSDTDLAAGEYWSVISKGQYWKGSKSIIGEISKSLEKKNTGISRCYINCIEISQRTGLKYYEGVAIGMVPRPHAWLLKSVTGEIFDPTWDKIYDLEEVEYLGVEVDKESLKKWNGGHEWYSPLMLKVINAWDELE